MKKIEFTALEIGSGDAFLLEDNEINIIFDSGGSKTTIVRVLKKKKIYNVHLAICSHNDIDHANGFIGLLDSDISIGEIWLPVTWASILDFIIDNKCELFELRHHFANNSVEINDEIKPQIDGLYSKESISVEDFDERLSYISELIEIYNFTEWDYWYHHHALCGNPIIIRLERIMKIAGLAYQHGCKIRWFEPTTKCKKNAIAYGLVPLNSMYVSCVSKIKDTMSFLQMLTLTEENKHSLVFEYLKNGIPIVRFSADSNYTCQSVEPYKNHIIVTAPHHGSEANDNVYKNLKGDDIIWVRSDRKSQKRPCATFKGLSNKYCLACSVKNFKSRLCFNYDCSKNKWDCINGNICSC